MRSSSEQFVSWWPRSTNRTQFYMQLAKSTDNKLAVKVLKEIADEELVHAG